MRELDHEEIDKVHGGIAPAIGVSLAIAAVGGGLAGYHEGGWKGAAVGAVLGVGAATAGAMATVTTGFVRLAWAVRGVGWTAIGGGIASTGH